jgi:hypothetical protein
MHYPNTQDACSTTCRSLTILSRSSHVNFTGPKLWLRKNWYFVENGRSLLRKHINIIKNININFVNAECV